MSKAISLEASGKRDSLAANLPVTAVPYPGLRSFHPSESDIFFGREEQTDQLLIRLKKAHFLGVVGASGCGKSSLVRAGLIPSLELGFMTDAGCRWRIAEMRPGDKPLRSLAEALLAPTALGSPDMTPEEAGPFLQATLRRGPKGLLEAVYERPLPAASNLLLLVDQFEETFRFRRRGEVKNSDEADEAAAFVALLITAAAQRELPIYVVITMRSDFLGDCAVFTGLPEALNDNQFLTPRMTREQYRAAIESPARVCGGRIEPALTNQLLNEMGTDPDQLPLLQHALMRMWNRRSSSLLTLADYKGVTGMANALSEHADDVLAELDSGHWEVARVLFCCLTERGYDGRDTRRPTSVSDIAAVAGVPWETVAAVADLFRGEGRNFIMPPPDVELRQDTVLDIGHESLIRQWWFLRDWVDEEAACAAMYRRICDTARLWLAEDANLWDNRDLERGLAWEKHQCNIAWARQYGTDEDFHNVTLFLRASEKKEEEERRQEKEKKRTDREREEVFARTRQRLQRWTVATLFSSVVIVLAVLLWAAYGARIQAQSEKIKALESAKNDKMAAALSLSRDLAANSISQLPLDPQLSALLACEAIKASPTAPIQAVDALRKSVMVFIRGTVLFRTDQGSTHPNQTNKSELMAASASADGRYIVTSNSDNTAAIWNPETGKRIQVLKGHSGAILNATFSGDGRYILTASKDKTARIWDIANIERREPNCVGILTHPDIVSDARYNSDNSRIVTACSDSYVRVFNANTHELVPWPKKKPHLKDVNSVIFSPDGNHIAAAGNHASAKIWDTNIDHPNDLIRYNDDPLTSITYSSNGQYILTTSADKTARIWDATTYNAIAVLNGHEGTVNTASYSPDGKFIVTASDDNTARIWNASTWQLDGVIYDDKSPVKSAFYSHDGKYIIAAREDGVVSRYPAIVEKSVSELLTLARRQIKRQLTPAERTLYLHEAAAK